MIRFGLVYKAWGLMHIHSFSEVSMEEGIFDIKLVYRPFARHNQAKNSAYGGGLYHRVESFITVDPNLLCFTICDKTSLIAL